MARHDTEKQPKTPFGMFSSGNGVRAFRFTGSAVGSLKSRVPAMPVTGSAGTSAGR